MTKQAAKKIKETEDSFQDNHLNIIDEYKDLNDRMDVVLEKIYKKQNKKKNK